MALYCRTGAGLNLNDLTNYVFVGIDLGKPNRGETWIVPKVKGATPALAQFWDEAVLMRVTIGVRGSTVANLIANAEAVRNEYVDKANTLAWSPDDSSQAVRTFTTYASPIGPFLDDVTPRQVYIAVNAKAALRWDLFIWRQPYYNSDTRPPVA